MILNKKRKLKRKPLWYLITAVIFIIVLFTCVNFSKGIYKIWRFSRLKNEEIKAIEDLNKENEKLELETERLKSDSIYIEELARKEYGMIKKGEEIFHITLPDTITKGKKDER